MMQTISRLFASGLFVIAPILLTITFIWWLFATAEQVLRAPL